MEPGYRSLFLPTNSGYSALTLLTRLAQRRPDSADWVGKALHGRVEILSEIAMEVAIETGGLMGLKLAEEIKHYGSAELVARVQDLCDSDPYLLAVSLRDVARVSTEGRLAALRGRRYSLDIEENFDYAISANNLGLRLWFLDASNAGLHAVEDAVGVCRKLSEVDPDRFLPELARTLNSFSTLLAATGRTEEAVAALQESLGILRKLASSNQDELLPDLAMALNNLGNRLNTLGRHEETLLVMQEAVEIFRRVSIPKPGPLLSFFATALGNLGNALGQTGRSQEALQVTQEAVDMRRLLVEHSPDAFLPDLANGLHNLARRLGSLGLQENALEAAREAFEIRKQLTKQQPETFLAGFIRSVNALARRLQEAGKGDEALEIVKDGGRILAPFLAQGMHLEGRLASAVESYRELCASLGEPCES
jgi:tetratricopeptide (TPR) repeat protein